MNRENQVFTKVTYYDSAWRIVVVRDGLEHMHREAFPERKEAYELLGEIRLGLLRGADLNLALWETADLS